MKTFAMKNGLEFMLDDEDYMLAVDHSWFLQNRYVQSVIKGKRVRLHRLLVDVKPGEEVDHIDGNPLNNQKSNLRICSRRENAINRKPWSEKNHRRGVRRSKNGVKWEAYILIGRDYHNLGRYNTEEDACRAYNDVAKTLSGEYAWLYPIPGDDTRPEEE